MARRQKQPTLGQLAYQRAWARFYNSHRLWSRDMNASISGKWSHIFGQPKTEKETRFAMNTRRAQELERQAIDDLVFAQMLEEEGNPIEAAKFFRAAESAYNLGLSYYEQRNS